MGLSGELQQLGAKLLIADVQCQFVFDKTSFCEPFSTFVKLAIRPNVRAFIFASAIALLHSEEKKC